MLLAIVVWIAIGVIIGFTVNKLINLRGDDPKLGIGAAAVGAVVIAGIFSFIRTDPVSAWNVWTLLFAVIGAVAGVIVWHIIRSRTISHDRYVPRRSY